MIETGSDKSACERCEGFVRLVTSLDGPYAISDCFRSSFGAVKSRLLICTPWEDKSFIDSMRSIVPNGVEIFYLTKLPDKKDRSFDTVESLLEVADAKGWKPNIRCSPKLHEKFFIIDENICISGSVNATNAGVYYNHEHLIVGSQTSWVKEFSTHFFKLWNQLDNIPWQNVRMFHGNGRIGFYSNKSDIAERILGFFRGNGNIATLRWKVCKDIVSLGYMESDVIAVIRNLVQDGILYEPKLDFIQLASVNLD